MMPAAVLQALNKLDPSVPFLRDLELAPARKARILFDHPHSGREWAVVGPVAGVPGFYQLCSTLRVEQAYCQSFTLCLHESRFEAVV